MKTEAGHAEPASVTPRTHLLVAGVLVVLTLAAFLGAGFHVLSIRALVPILLVFALAQIVLQATYYMRLRVSRGLFAMFFAAGVCLAVVVVVMVMLLIPL